MAEAISTLGGIRAKRTPGSARRRSNQASGALLNNAGYFLACDDPRLLACLNAPIGWWFAWRGAQHAKDEALRYFNTLVERYPIPSNQNDLIVAESVNILGNIQQCGDSARRLLADWYRHSLDTPMARRLAEAARLERRLSDLVNEAYGLTSDGVALMWRTASPRMPIAPPPSAAA